MDKRLTEIEIKLAYLEDMVVTLNTLLIEQGKELELLKREKERLEEQIIELVDASEISVKKPPHY